jgi:hypothetical protein
VSAARCVCLAVVNETAFHSRHRCYVQRKNLRTEYNCRAWNELALLFSSLAVRKFSQHWRLVELSHVPRTTCLLSHSTLHVTQCSDAVALPYTISALILDFGNHCYPRVSEKSFWKDGYRFFLLFCSFSTGVASFSSGVRCALRCRSWNAAKNSVWSTLSSNSVTARHFDSGPNSSTQLYPSASVDFTDLDLERWNYTTKVRRHGEKLCRDKKLRCRKEDPTTFSLID